MSATENRIVKMIFDNAQFKKAASETSTQLSAIDKQVANAGKGGSSGLLEMGKAMDGVKVKASAMQVAAVTAIANIANRAVNAGIQMAKSLTIDPIKQGFDEYELKMKSIQTILANTDGESLKSVTKTLNELNKYADKTIYNFANMTDAIGKMTTAGIDMKVATKTVQGFHNMVALSGGDAGQAAGALEQFNQGLQTGVIKLIDWKSLQTRGLGSKALQESFFETARAMGTITDLPVGQTFDEWAKANGGFNATLEKGWLTADVATKAYSIMAGEFKTVEELMKQGFSRKAAEDMLQTAKDAEESATKVRTFSGFMDTLKESVGSGWSQVFELIIGDFNEATNIFTKMSETAGNIVSGFFGGLTKILKGFDKLGGKTNLLRALSNIAAPMVAIFRRLGDLIEKVFGGGKPGEGASKFAKALEHATRPLRVLAKLIEGTITPSEALVRIWKIVTNGLRNMTNSFGPAGDKAQSFIDKMKGLSGIFSGGISFGTPELPSLPSLPSLDSVFGGGDAAAPIAGLAAGIDQVTGSVSRLNQETASGTMFNPNADISAGRVTDATDRIRDSLDSTSVTMEKVKEEGGSLLDYLKKGFENLTSSFNMNDLMASFNLAILATMGISFSNFMNSISRGVTGISGLFGSLGDALEGFAKAANKQAWAKIILNLGIAIGLLSVSLWLLSRIPMGKMITGLAGMAGIMMIMKVGIDSISSAVEKMDGKGTALKLTGLSLALLALGFAVLTLSAAFLILNKVDWSSMLKGLGTIIVVMKTMEMMGKIGEHGAKNLLGTAVALGALAVSFVVLAGALMLFQLVKWESMAKAGLVLAALTLAIGLLALIPYEGIAKVGLAMLSTSVGMLAIANALILFSLVKWESIGKAAVILTLLTLALAALMYVGGGPVGAASILAMGAALMMIAAAGLMLNKVEWSSLAKVGVILVALVLGFAAFLAVISFFAPALILLSLFAGQLALLALAITGLTLAFALIFPLLAAGAGVFAAFATGAAVAIAVFLQTLALQAPIMKDSMLKILKAMIDGIVEAVPMVIDGINRLWDAVKKEFSDGGGGGKKAAFMGEQGESWIEKLGDGIKKMIPKIVDKAVELLTQFIGALAKHGQKLASKGVELIVNLINGISSKIGDIVGAAINLIIQFAQGIASGYAQILSAGVKLIADFLHALADTIRNGSQAIGGGIKDVVSAFYDVGVNLMEGLINGIKSLAAKPKEWIEDIVGQLPKWARKLLGIASPSKVFFAIGKFLVEGLSKGIQANAASAITATAAMVSGSIAVAASYMSKFVQDLDQQAIAAMAKAEGLQAAADKAAKAAEKTKKNKKDDRAARRLQDRADAAATTAERREARAEAARAAEERAEEFAEATLIERAQMRAEDAQMQIDQAKAAELSAASKLEQARALREHAKAKGVSKKDAKDMRDAAERLEKQAAAEAERANALIAAARVSAADAMALQKAAADAAAADFQARYEQEAREDAEEDAFEKMTDEEKAAERRRQAAALQAKADQDLARAKELAYTDLEAANELAEQALDQAEQARQYLRDAEQYELSAKQAKDSQSVNTGGQIVNLDPTETAAIAFNDYAQQYNAGMAASAGDNVIEFNQYNTSPEYLSEADIYRRTNNQLEFAGARLGVPA